MKTLASYARQSVRRPRGIAGAASTSGFALVESSVAMALMSLMLGCMFATNAHLLGLLQQGKQSAFATELIQERVEQMRTSVWNEVTDPSNLSFLAAQAQAKLTTANLPGVTETIRVEPLINPANVRITCTRPPTGAPTVTGPSLTGEKSVKVTVSIQWQGGKRTRSRGVCTILTNKGV